MKIQKKWIAMSMALIVAACGDSDSLSVSDLNEILDESPNASKICEPFMLNVDAPKNASIFVGESEIHLLKRLDNGKRANTAAQAQMDILVGAGLYEDLGVRKVGEGEKTQRFATYQLTPKGWVYVQLSPHAPLLCMGQLKATKIHYYTEPVSVHGMLMRKVSFEGHVKPESWAKRLWTSDDSYEKRIQSWRQHIWLAKTNHGWRDAQSLR